jgi:hypothetical protein
MKTEEYLTISSISKGALLIEVDRRMQEGYIAVGDVYEEVSRRIISGRCGGCATIKQFKQVLKKVGRFR